MSVSSEKKIRFGVISASGIAAQHMNGIRMNHNSELVSLCDTDKEKLKNVGSQFGVEKLYTDYKEMLEKENLDAVVIATPDQLHAEMTITALEAGKHVLCEKPMALKLDECKAMVKASEKTGKKLMIGQICRFTPGFRTAKELIDAGEIGRLFYVESEYAHDYTDVIPRGKWRLDPLRNGVVGGGCHAVDLLRWVAGNPTQVCAFANRKIFPDWPTDDCTVSILKFPDEVIGKIFVSLGCRRNYTMRSVFYGDKGTIVATNTLPTISVYKQELNGSRTVLGGRCQAQTIPLEIPVDISSHNAMAEINEFIQSIAENKPVPTDGRQGACTVAACLAIVESTKRNEIVTVDYNF